MHGKKEKKKKILKIKHARKKVRVLYKVHRNTKGTRFMVPFPVSVIASNQFSVNALTVVRPV